MPAMKLAAFAALVGSVAALPAYSNTTTTYACNPAHSYPGASCISTAGSLTLVTAAPVAATTYACNPAHSYPNGASCISTAGSLTLVTPAPVAATTYACNPAHSYPGASCISTAGTLSLVKNNATGTPVAAAKTSYVTEVVTALTTFCPQSTQLTHNGVTYTVSSATTLTITNCPCTITHTSVVPPTTSAPVAVPTYACNPAHSYPNGATCISTAGTLSLVTPTASAPVSSAPAVTYACNPAHSYPNGATCISTAGTLSLVTPAASAPVSSAPAVTYACNPAHSYPNGATCISTAGTLSLVTSAASAPISSAPAVTYACNPAHSYPNGAKCISTAGTLSLVTPVPAQSTAVVPPPAVSTAVIPPPAQSMPVVPAPAQSTAATCPPPAAPVTVTVTATVTVNTCTAAATTPAPVVPATTYACNPAHSYPNNVQCISSGTGLTLVTPTALTTTSYVCSTSSGGVACSPVSTFVVSTSTKAITLTSTSTATKASSSSSAPAVSSSTKASSSAPVASSSSKAASSTVATNTTFVVPLNTAGATACPLNLPTDYQYPHLLKINGTNGYFGQVDKNTNTTFTFDIPQSYSGKTCTTYFAIPAKSKLVTTDYTLGLADGAKVFFESEGKQVASFSPNPVDQKWVVKSEKCQAGKAVEYNMYASASLTFRWFNDYNACALGAFMVPS